jgi:VIT1/CCC1 family predicted Fe2+/Mn2+ transporter
LLRRLVASVVGGALALPPPSREGDSEDFVAVQQQPPQQRPRDNDGGGGVYLRSAVHGALDGIVTTFTTICAAYGVNISVPVMVQMGSANVIGDALSIALSDAMSTGIALRSARSHIQQLQLRVKREHAVVARELALLLVRRRHCDDAFAGDASSGGDSGEDGNGNGAAAAATSAVLLETDSLLERNERALNAVDGEALALMLAALEVDSAAPADRRSDSWVVLSRQALVTAVAFIVSGTVPIAALWAGAAVSNSNTGGFVCSMLTTLLLLCALGTVNARYASMTVRQSVGLLLVTTTPTVLLVYGISASITAMLPPELRDAETCNLINYFVRAAPR